jgi:hydroxymethylpyrimidine/phosphomethylpyrimidine kinase
MLYDENIIETVAKNLIKYNAKNIIVDPVMVSKSGAKLLMNKAIKTLKEKLLNITTLITPNIPEAAELTGLIINNVEDMKKAAIVINKMGCKSVLIKGGHLKNHMITDVLYHTDRFYYFESKKIDTKNTHGTGCTYSSAIAANLAKDFEMVEAVSKANVYVHNTIKYASQLGVGKGFGPLNHFYFMH